MPKRKLLATPVKALVRTKTRRVRRMKAKNYDQMPFKIRYSVNLTTSAGGELTPVFSTSDPEGAVNSSGTYNDWTSLEALWDSYKVTGFRIQFHPFHPNGGGGTSSVAQAPIYLVQDPDDITALSTVATAIQYNDVKILRADQTWDRYFKVQAKSSDGNPVGWLNIGNAGSSTNRISSVKMYADGLTGSTDYGRITLTLYIQCKGRR